MQNVFEKITTRLILKTIRSLFLIVSLNVFFSFFLIIMLYCCTFTGSSKFSCQVENDDMSYIQGASSFKSVCISKSSSSWKQTSAVGKHHNYSYDSFSSIFQFLFLPIATTHFPSRGLSGPHKMQSTEPKKFHNAGIWTKAIVRGSLHTAMMAVKKCVWLFWIN